MSLRSDAMVMQMLPDGRRLNLRSGPMELVIEAFGPHCAVKSAYRRAMAAFPEVLPGLVADLNVLRKPLRKAEPQVSSPVSRAMLNTATAMCGSAFATPMICVAGAVADHVLFKMRHDADLSRIYVNNGGDIAIWLAPGQSFDVGICTDLSARAHGPMVRVTAGQGVGGIATSGWRGRSHSLGIADAVTVLARDARTADAAATLIANSVDLPGHSAVTRMPACELSPDSDLGSRPVTTGVDTLSQGDVALALRAGQDCARKMIDADFAVAVFACLQGQSFALHQSSVRPSIRSPDIGRTPLEPELVEHA